ncbi:hypothetical protein [Agrococcus casei]|uniref:hypothetical protein n=1 Tax=Agrococcus casei TaxID=343512 RepID=UPI003F8E3E23
MAQLRVLNWNLDAYHFDEFRLNAINEFNRPKRDAIYEMIRSHLPSEDGTLPCIVILTEVPILLLDGGPDSLQARLGQCGLQVHFHRPAFAARRQRNGVVVALSSHFSPARVVNVPESLSNLIDTLILETALDGVGHGVLFALRPLVGDCSAQDYAKRADGLFGLINEVVRVSRSHGADFVLGAGDFNHAKIYGDADASWEVSEVRKPYRGKYQQPIAYQKIKTELVRRELALVTPRTNDGIRLATSIGEHSFDHTIAPMSWSLTSSRYIECSNASDHALQVSDFSTAVES